MTTPLHITLKEWCYLKLVISQVPLFALGATAFSGMLLVVLYLMAQSGSFASALPIIALYAFAGYRLMPALQQIYGAVTQLRFAGRRSMHCIAI